MQICGFRHKLKGGNAVVGRDKEQKELLRRYRGNRAEFIAVYGRRRVGKTFLIDETFRDKITFRHAGLSPVEGKTSGQMKDQLEQFYYSLLKHGMKKSKRPADWLEAFFMLELFLQEKDDGTRQVIFLDELPWLDTPRSGFITALEGFWNNWCCNRHNLMLIVCGSSSSWILDKLIHNHGGLYGRITCEIKLAPFNLRESEELFQSNGVRLSRYDITQSYMILGGIPYYLNYFEPGLSLAQNIDRLFFEKQAKLKDEYDCLFTSVFESPDYMKKLVETLSRRSMGYTRKEMIESGSFSEGTRLTDALKALIAGDFVDQYIPFGYSKREIHYKLKDPFCCFWLHFLSAPKGNASGYWQSIQETPRGNTWNGLAFEQVCFTHVDQIKARLGISGIRTNESAWTLKGMESAGTQIDLLLERGDNVINACEIKFTAKEYRVDQAYYRLLLRRQELLRESVSQRKTIQNTLITTFGLEYNEYSGIFSNVVTLEDLFKT